MTNVNQAQLYADSSRGIFIPQHFAESFNPELWNGVDRESLAILLEGPDHESYWETWESVLNNAETTYGGILHHDGDLWVVWPQLAIDAINKHCEIILGYEESHHDAGDNYAHRVAESWDEQRTRDLMEQMNGPEVRDVTKEAFTEGWYKPAWTINTMGLESDVIADLALDLFYMESGTIWGCYKSGLIILESFHVQEVETELSHLDIDGVTMDLIRESCEAYISGTDLAYMTTDAVWYAVVKPADLQAAIKERIESND